MEIKIKGSERDFQIKIDSEDHWSVYTDISMITSALLKNFLQKTRGYPSEFHDKDEETAFQKWKETLQTMIDAFDLIEKYQENIVGYSQVHEGLELFNKYFFNLWD